jgi:EmrB/QacA subfamily drug resistance transporter
VTAQPTELSRQRRNLVLGICCLSLLIVGMDSTIVNVALPSIRTHLHASLSGLQWTIDAYTLVLASLLVLSGSTADRLGRRRTFQVGLAVFTLGSLLCSQAPTLEWLVAFRMVQAVGGSMLNPVAMSIITNVFTDPRERARAIGVWGGVVGISLGLGPVVGGLLVDTIGWRSIFWINVPIGVVAFALAARFVPESKAPRARRLDLVGQVLVIAALASLTYGIIEAGRVGWANREIAVVLVVAVASVVAFVTYELRRFEPLIELRFFRSAPFAGATAIAVCVFASFAGFLFLSTIYLQEVRGLSALMAGVTLLPMAAMTIVFAPLSGRFVANHGPRRPLILSGIAMALGAAGLSRIGAHTDIAWLILAYVVFAFGFSVANAPITNTAVSGMPREQAGVAAAIASTSRQVGASLGVAVLGTVLNSGSGRSVTAHFADAGPTAWWIIAGLGVGVVALSLLTTGSWARGTAQRTADRLEVDEVAPQLVVAD